MPQTISITSKWQVSIPVSIRKDLKLDKPGPAEVETKDGKIVITPKRSEVFKFAGKFHAQWKKNPINIDKIRDHIDYSKL